jgi:hypothetical protein
MPLGTITANLYYKNGSVYKERVEIKPGWTYVEEVETCDSSSVPWHYTTKTLRFELVGKSADGVYNYCEV